MRLLTELDIQNIHGGASPNDMRFPIALTAGLVAGYVTSLVPSVSTLAGTLAVGGAGAIICTPFAPVVGTFVCGCVGGMTGYLLSSTFAPLMVGAAVTVISLIPS